MGNFEDSIDFLFAAPRSGLAHKHFIDVGGKGLLVWKNYNLVLESPGKLLDIDFLVSV